MNEETGPMQTDRPRRMVQALGRGSTTNTNTEPRHRPATVDPDADADHPYTCDPDTCGLPLRAR